MGGHSPGPATNAGVGGGFCLVDDFAGRVALRADRDTESAIGEDGLVVVIGDVFPFLEFEEFVHRDEGLWHFTDGDNAGAVGIDFAGDELLGAVGQRDHGDNGRNTDDDAQKGEDAAELAGPKRLEGEFDGLSELHGCISVRQRPWARFL
jgi:hypothetical protein